jgi:hypothetical protein
MTVRDDDYRRDTGDRVNVSDGVPTDRIRWGPILAGTFAALTMLVVLSTLGSAIGISTYDQGDNARRYMIGAGIWGVITMLISFGFGGWLTARSAAVRGGDNGLMNGFMVAGVGIPILLFVLGSAGVLMTHAAASNPDITARTDGAARQASSIIPANPDTDRGATYNPDDAKRAAQRAAWSTLIALILAIGAASAAGYIGSRDDIGHHHAGHRHGSSSTGGTGMTT